MYRVFVSYSTQDLEWANNLKLLLTDAQVTIFVANHDVTPGTSLSARISSEIKSCDLFLLLWSSHARESTYVQNEIFLAKAEGKKILPVLLERGLQLPTSLGDLKYLSVDQNPETALGWLKSHVSTSAQSKATSNLVAIAVWGLIGWAVYKSIE